MSINGACYIRVSTDEQTEYSPDAQLRSLRDYAIKNEISLAEEHIYIDEGISGRKADKRPAFMKMIAAAKVKPKPFDVILVHKFDRFARSREDSVVYKSLLKKEAGIKVISITETIEDDKFSVILEAMLEAMAEYYSLNLADEVKKGLFEKARRGENIGKAPFGYKLINSQLVPDETDSATVKLLFDMCANKSVTQAVKYLNENGYKTKNGGSFSQATVTYLLQNPVYYGQIRYNYRKSGRRGLQNPPSEWIIADANHIPIISKEIFDKVQERLTKNKRLYGRNYNEQKIKSWLQHTARCSDCGSVLTVGSCNNKTYNMFRCSHYTLGACSVGNTISARKLERMTACRLKEDIILPDRISAILRSASVDDGRIAELRKRLMRIEKKRELINQAYLAEIDSLGEYKRNKELLNAEDEAINRELQALKEDNEKKRTKTQNFKSLIDILGADSISICQKNLFIKQFIKEVRVDLKNKDITVVYYF